MTCENCWNLKHYKCHDPECSCSVCAHATAKPAKPRKVRTDSNTVVTDRRPKAERKPQVRKPRPKKDPAERRKPGPKPGPRPDLYSLTPDQRREIYAQMMLGLKISQIVECTGFTRHQVKGEVYRCRQGILPVDA